MIVVILLFFALLTDALTLIKFSFIFEFALAARNGLFNIINAKIRSFIDGMDIFGHDWIWWREHNSDIVRLFLMKRGLKMRCLGLLHVIIRSVVIKLVNNNYPILQDYITVCTFISTDKR